MDAEQLKRLIIEILQSQQVSDIKLLEFAGDNRYKIDRFLAEAKEIGKKCSLKICVDSDTKRYLTGEKLNEIPNVRKIYRCGEQIDVDDVFDGVDTVILGSTGLNLASKVANLITDSLSSTIASESILRGIRLISVPVATEDIQAKNKSYYEAIKNIEKVLISYRIELVDLENIREVFKSDYSDSVNKVPRVLTEDFIKKYTQKELKIDNDTVITPLAKDAIREKKISLSRGK
jgi:hypothetical protein